MYNGHEYLSCIKIPTAKQATTKSVHRAEKTEPMDLAADRRDLISAANKVFGEGKWNHSIVNQTLDFVDTIDAANKINVQDNWHAGCVTFIKVQLDNGNFHEDIGYHIAEESTKGLSIQNARIGSAVNALKRVLLLFGDKIEKELQQREIKVKPANNVQRDVAIDEQISVKSNVPINTFVSPVQSESKLLNEFNEPFEDTDGKKIKVPACTVQTQHISKPEYNILVKKNSNLLKDPTLIAIVNDDTTDKLSPPVKVSAKIVKPVLPKNEILRMERKRKQMEKQMEFKRRMMEKEILTFGDNKPNPRY